jgi:hypothetical protein
MADVIATIEELNDFTVSIQEQGLALTSIEAYNPITVPSLSDIGNVDTSNLTNGSVLVYTRASERWVSTTTLSAQNIEAGEF